MAFSVHPRPATKVSATRVSAETSETSETHLVALELATNRQTGSGKCGNPAQCRFGRDATVRRRVTRALAETAETPSGGEARQAAGGPRRWRRGWDSNPRYACTHNGFRDRPDRPLWHLSGAPLIGGRFCRGNSAVGGADLPLFRPESGLSGVDLGGFLRIFRPPPAGHSGPPRSFVLSGILGMGPASPPIRCGVEGRVRSTGRF
jgi:hypothetical protein